MTNSHETSLVAFVVVGSVIFTEPMIAFAQNGQTEFGARAASIAIEYKNCVIEWVGSNLVASATPTEMAEGGHSTCVGKLQEFEEAQKAELLSVTPPGQEFRAKEKAASITTDVREMTKAHIIRLIIEVRSGSDK